MPVADQPRKSLSSRRLTPAGVAAVYALFTALWVVTSYFSRTSGIESTMLQDRAELLKGLIFTAISALTLYLLLKRWQESMGNDRNMPAAPPRPLKSYRLILLFVALTLAIPLIGLAVIRLYEPQIERDAYANLQAVADLKAGQINHWLDERHGDSIVLAASTEFAQQVEQLTLQQKHDARKFNRVLERLSSLHTAYGYNSIMLLDAGGKLLATIGNDVDIPAMLQDLLRQSLHSKQIQRSDLYRDEFDRINMDWVVPIVVSDQHGERAVAAVVLRIAPDDFLFPLIQTWPTSSASAETLLVRREGGSVLFLNALRQGKDAALTLKLPLSEPTLSAAVAVTESGAGTVQGLDYRGAEVLAAYRPVEGTNWHLIAKIDRDEVLAPLRLLAFLTSLIASFALTVVSVMVVMLWRQQQRNHMLQLQTHAMAVVEESERRFRAVAQSANDAIVNADSAGNIVNWNPGAERLFGYSETEISGKSLVLLVPERYRDSHLAGLARVAAGGESHVLGKTVELSGLRKDGSEFPLELSLSKWRTSSGLYFTSIIRDITERKKAEDALALQAHRAEALLELPRAAEQLDETAFMQRGQELAENLTGSRIAFIHFVNDDEETIQLVAWSRRTLEQYCRAAFEKHYPVREAGIWADALRQRKPVVFNDYLAYPNKHGLPEGHSELKRLISVPVIEHGKVVMLTGVGNKETDYTDLDVETVQLISNSIWRNLQRRRAEKKLVQFNLVLEQSLNEIYIFDSETLHFVDVNLGALTNLGYTLEELQRMTPLELEPSVSAESFAALAAPLRSHEKRQIQFETTHRRKDGSFYPAEVHLELAGDAPSFFVAIIQDISERKRAEESLRKLSLAVEQSPNSIVITDLDAKIEYANAAFTKATGYSLDEAIGQNPRILHSDKTPKTTYEDMWAQLMRGEVWKGEFTNKRKDGSEYIESVLISPVRQADGRVTHYLAIKEDITQFKQAQEAIYKLNEELEEKVAARTAELAQANADISRREEEIRSVVDNMLDCIITIDERGIIRSANPTIEKIFGYTHEEVIGQNVSLLMPEPDHSAHDGYIQRHCNTGEARIIGIGREVVGLHKNGERIPLELSVSEYFVQGRHYYTGILRDIRERKHIMADLEQARLNAEQANRAKSDFLAAMSHEIRTPMNGVIGMIDVLQQSSLDASQSKIANVIHDSAFALLAVIDDILDFSKIEAGKLNIEHVPMDIASIAEGVCETLDHMALKKEVELTLFVAPDLHTAVMGDPVRLRQILINLANNAIKFSCGQGRQAKVSVRVTQKSTTASGEQVLDFCVIDNGIGIDAATQMRLFAPFTQADTSTTRTFGGTGLGLAISRQLANMMGGDISVRSEPNEGAAFTVRLPFVPFPESLETDHPPSLVAGLSCLVVGAQTLASDLANYLTHGGAVVEQVTNPGAAQHWINGRPAGQHIVVVDMASRTTSPPAELRTAARARPDLKIRFVVIGRGRRRSCRIEASGDISVDANNMRRNTFLKAVAIAAGRIVDQNLLNSPDWAKSAPAAIAPLSREEALRRGRLILIAEDNEINQKVIHQQLTLLGQTADIADNGSEALKRWGTGNYGILITDLHMPKMDGYELTEAIRSAESRQPDKGRIPIIAFTANALKGESERCRAAGMDDYLSKPVQLANLKAMLEKWLPATVPGAVHPTLDSAGSVQAAPDAKTGAAPIPVDVNVLKALVGDDTAIIAEFLHDFRISSDNIAAELRSAHTQGNTAAVGVLAHKLKSSARSVGALTLGELCAEMERAGKAGQAADLAALMPRFEAEVIAVCSYLASY